MEFDEDDFDKIVDEQLGRVSIDLEKQILEIINRGSAASEPTSRRPIRELIQNADDALSDRVFVHFDEQGLTFQNDGLGLTGEINRSGDLVGTVTAILRIFDGHKEEDELASGNFGSGFRSTHLFSDGSSNSWGYVSGWEAWKVGQKCSVHTDKVERIDKSKVIIPTVRRQNERPKRRPGMISQGDGAIGFESDLGDEVKRCGVHFYWPWRKKFQNKKWEPMVWDSEKIETTALDCVKVIEQILLGCRWIREAVVSIDLKNHKSTKAWIRDYNIHEYLSTDSVGKVSLLRFSGNKPVAFDKVSHLTSKRSKMMGEMITC